MYNSYIFKNGGNIHIKESKKGSFTKYCNGKVTNKCILKGKNSPNSAIRKKAIFALNARKWKHNNGGTVIKVTSAEDGTKLSFGQKVGNFLNSDDGQALVSGIYNIGNGIAAYRSADKTARLNLKLFDTKWNNKKLNLISQKMKSASDSWDKYSQNYLQLNVDSHLGSIDRLVFNNNLRQLYSTEAENELAESKAEAQDKLNEQNSQLYSSALDKIYGGISDMVGLLGKTIGKKQQTNNFTIDTSGNITDNKGYNWGTYNSGTYTPRRHWLNT